LVELVELQTIAYIAQTVGVVGTLTAAFIAVRSYINANKRSEEANKKEQETRDRDLDTRQAQLLMQIYDRVNNRDFTRDWGETNYFWKWDDYNDYFKKYGANLDESPHLITDEGPPNTVYKLDSPWKGMEIGECVS